MNEEQEGRTLDDKVIELQQRNELLEIALREVQEKANQKIILNELQSLALQNGMIHLDGLKLADHSEVTIDNSGNVQGATALITKLKHDKPWLFHNKNSSSLAPIPASSPMRAKMATEMTLQEWRAARDELLRRK